MITRKRGRSLANPVTTTTTITTDTSTCPQSDTQKSSDQSEENVVTSPESDTNDWGLEELFGPDFSLNLDRDLIDSLSFGDTHAPTKDETHGSLVLDVPTPRSRLHDVSSQLVNKNAMAARINRLKKKEYIRGLEQNIDALVSENRVLKQENGSLASKVEELESETRYLRAVLANESMLAQLLSRLSGVNGMKFSTSLFQESQKNDHDYAMPRKRVKVEDADAAGGICLHVDKDHVSVEFCTKCAESSSLSLKM